MFCCGKSLTLECFRRKAPSEYNHVRPTPLPHRPHRIRLLKEIKRRKRAQESVNAGVRPKRSEAMASTRATNEITTTSTLHDGRAPVEEMATEQKSAPSQPRENQTLEAASPHPAKEKKDASKQEVETGQPDKVTDSSSTSTACTPYDEVGSHAQELSPLAGDYATTPRAVGDIFHPRSTGRNDAKGGEAPSSAQVSEPSERRRQGAPFVRSSDESAERGFKTPGVKGTLQISGVRAGNIKIALGGSDPFLQVKTCDQLRRTNAVAGKGEKSREMCPEGNLCYSTSFR